MDEIEIIQHNQMVFKGCLQHGGNFLSYKNKIHLHKRISLFIFVGQLAFKSQRYRIESKLKLKFYINGFLEDEMIACCEHGLIYENRHNHLFEIIDIFGSKPCYKFS